MKKFDYLAGVSFLCVILAASTGCGSSSGGSGGGSTSGTFTLELAGDETATTGTEIIIGEIDYDRPDLTGTSEAIVAVDENSMVVGQSAPVPGDLANVVIMVVRDATISMTIVKNAVEHDYACGGSFISCGSLDFDIGNRRAEFVNTTVVNTNTASIMTINGELSW